MLDEGEEVYDHLILLPDILSMEGNYFEEDDVEDPEEVAKRFKTIYQTVIIKLISKQRSYNFLKKFLLQVTKNIAVNMENPLYLSDFLTSCLDHESQLDVQILSLRAIFILLEKHGLDYPNYYKRLYGLILPQYKSDRVISVFTSIAHEEKVRFLRLLDLSLRSAKIPSKVIAAFIKRLCRVMMTYGCCLTQSDKMYVISFIANMIKRHPRCVRLIHRKKKLYKESQSFETDPFKHEEVDPSKSKALKSSLWELETLIKTEFDESVRNYCKLFKGDISRKTSFFKCEEFSGMDSLSSIADDIKAIDL